MNEQEQAELLAAWLEDPSSGTPTGLDPDVVEGVVALHPELAPAPRLSADDILGEVRTGPLANPMPTGASVGAAPEDAPTQGSSVRRRPWWLAAVGIGGVGSLVAAAALLLVVSSALLPSAPDREMASSEPIQAAPIPARDGVALGDTGLEGSARGPKVRPRPQTRPRPRPQVASKPKAPALDDAVAMEDDFDDRIDAEPNFAAGGGDVESDLDQASAIPEVRGGQGLADQPAQQPARAASPRPAEEAPPAAPPPPPADAAELEEYESEAIKAPSTAGATSGSRRQSRRDFESKKELDRPSARQKQKERHKSKPDRVRGNRASSAAPSDDAAPQAAPIAEVASTGPAPSLAQQARVGAEQATSPEIQAALAQLSTGDPRAALAAAEAGLATHTANTAVRQRLLVLKADALTQLGDISSARSAYQQAIALAASR